MAAITFNAAVRKSTSLRPFSPLSATSLCQ